MGLVFNSDRQSIVSSNDVQNQQLSALPKGLRALPLVGNWADGKKLTGLSEMMPAKKSLFEALELATPVPSDLATPVL